jgi:hypothetical protein
MKLILSTSLLLVLACATAKSGASPTAQSCGLLAPAVANQGTDVFSAPDGTSSVIVTLKSDTRVCVNSESEGFGYRRVRLADGRDGYVRESSLE